MSVRQREAREREREREREIERARRTHHHHRFGRFNFPLTILHVTEKEKRTYLKNALGFVKPDVQGESIRGSTKKRRRERHRENDFDREKAAATFPLFDSTTDRHDDVVAI